MRMEMERWKSEMEILWKSMLGGDQLKYSLCSAWSLGFHDPFWRAYFYCFSNGLVQPPSSMESEIFDWNHEHVQPSWIFSPFFPSKIKLSGFQSSGKFTRSKLSIDICRSIQLSSKVNPPQKNTLTHSDDTFWNGMYVKTPPNFLNFLHVKFCRLFVISHHFPPCDG